MGSQSQPHRLPYELWAEIIESGQFTNQRLLVLRETNPAFAEIVAKSLLKTIVLPLSIFQISPNTYNDIKDRLDRPLHSPQLARLRRHVRTIRIDHKLQQRPFAGVSPAVVAKVNEAMPGLQNVALHLYSDSKEPSKILMVSMGSLMGAFEEAGKKLHVRLDGVDFNFHRAWF